MQLTLKTTKNELKTTTDDKLKNADWRCVEVDIGNDPSPGGGGRVEFDPGFRNAIPIALRCNLSFTKHDSTTQTYEILCKRCR